VAAYKLPTGQRDARWLAKQASATKALQDTWSRYGAVTISYWKRQKFKASWLRIIRETLISTKPDDDPTTLSETDEPRSPAKQSVTFQPSTPSSIPHQHGPEYNWERKLTRKKREGLNPPTEDDDEPPSPSKNVASPTIEHAALGVSEISIKENHLEVIASLFSNAQQHVTSVRWNRFMNFMRDAGCDVKSSEGSSYTFTTKHAVTGENASVVLHRPHPDATLRAVHLRNYRSRIISAFGWDKEIFIVGK